MSIHPPSWLPKITSVDGSWDEVLKRLYGIFHADFIKEGCRFREMPVWWDRRRVLNDEYDEGFWHLITKVDEKGERLLDPRRAERLPWCKPTLNHSDDPEIKLWNYRESNRKIRTYVWIEQWDYVILLQIRRQKIGYVAFLITAYHVDYESTRRKLKAKYTRREP